MYRPRNNWEGFMSSVMRTGIPYLGFISYRFDVEKAREVGKRFFALLISIGMRIQDIFMLKFFKEPHSLQYIYGQYFHPITYNERVREVASYRRLRVLYKGFSCPEWAQSGKDDWEVDPYSIKAWDEARHEMTSEMTPMVFNSADRIDSNLINWFRFEGLGGGNSSRLFYNEDPKPTWYRHGHLDDPEKELHSFKWGDQNFDNFADLTGIDTSTPEGREAWEKEHEWFCTLFPEIFKKEQMVYPHTLPKVVTTEPYFQRMWQHFREHTFRVMFTKLN